MEVLDESYPDFGCYNPILPYIIPQTTTVLR